MVRTVWWILAITDLSSNTLPKMSWFNALWTYDEHILVTLLNTISLSCGRKPLSGITEKHKKHLNWP